MAIVYRELPPRERQRFRLELLERAGGLCGVCGEPTDPLALGPDRLTADHDRATADGGPDTPDNLQPAHARCNEQKGSDVGRWWAELERRRYHPD